MTDLAGGHPEDEVKNHDQMHVENENPDKLSPHERFVRSFFFFMKSLNIHYVRRRESRAPNGHRYSIQSNDMAFSDTVSNVVDFVKERHTKHRYRHNLHTRYRGSWSASSSPAHSPVPNRYGRESNAHLHDRYLPPHGTTSLQQRSRSPSPSQANTKQFKGSCSLL